MWRMSHNSFRGATKLLVIAVLLQVVHVSAKVKYALCPKTTVDLDDARNLATFIVSASRACESARLGKCHFRAWADKNPSDDIIKTVEEEAADVRPSNRNLVVAVEDEIDAVHKQILEEQRRQAVTVRRGDYDDNNNISTGITSEQQNRKLGVCDEEHICPYCNSGTPPVWFGCGQGVCTQCDARRNLLRHEPRELITIAEVDVFEIELKKWLQSLGLPALADCEFNIG